MINDGPLSKDEVADMYTFQQHLGVKDPEPQKMVKEERSVATDFAINVGSNAVSSGLGVTGNYLVKNFS